MDTIKLLLVEDDKDFREIIKTCLELTGEYKVYEAKDGLEGYEAFKSLKLDLIVTDIDMPKISGLAMIDLIRKEDKNIPIIVASGLTSPEEVHEGFKREIDNYIKKPYTADELMGFIRAMQKRMKQNNQIINEANKILPLGYFSLDVENRCLKYNDEIISLSKRETQILCRLFADKGKLVKRSKLLQEFWGSEDDPFHSRCLDVFITKIRKLLNNDPSISITTMRGEGLILNC